MASLFLLALCCTILLLLLTTIKFFKSRKSPASSDLPPGNMGWPIIGETLHFVPNPERFISERRLKYSSDIFKTSIIGEKVAVLCGPSANKFIYSNEAKLFTFWLPPSVAAILAVTNIDMTSYSMKLVTDEVHKFLKLESLQYTVPIMDKNSREHLDTHWSPDKELKIHHLAKDFTFSLSCHLFINCTPKQVKQLADHFFDMNDGGMSFKFNVPGTDYYRSRKREKALRKHLAGIIKQRIMEFLIKKDDDVDVDVDVDLDTYQDLLSRVLIASNVNGVTINEEEMAARFIALLFASFFTTSNTITFTLGYLAEYPHIYAKVLEEQLEIAESKGTGDVLNWKDIQKMKYSWNVVCESMRLQPPAFGSFREAITDFMYGGYRVPKGWKVHWNVHTTNKDAQHFPNPEKFNPSRFEENQVPPFAFVPFGGGPKMCTGKEYTRIELLVFLHNVVTKFNLFKVNQDEKIIYNPNPIPTEGLRLRFEHRQK